ncbi:AAA family ATPase [Sphingobacterium sp. HJSM2_6]|uniref:AAA family ATPase n=1 Tax=Sphingobacterium sp. HJSM2_6 TaxID=3366264 RepID=UPI003BE8DC79
MHIQDLIIKDKSPIRLEDVFLTPDNLQQIQQLIKEHLYVEDLKQYGLPVTHKVLLYGASGCGKTTTAKAIANTLGKPLIILNLSNIINSRIGETSQHLKQVFDRAVRDKAVLFLDEFDQIAKSRGEDDQDVGEMRRLVNTLIQLIDYFPEECVLIAASNHVQIIDPAIIRRFQIRISYELPNQASLDQYYDAILHKFPAELHPEYRKYHISYAEAKDYAFSVVKGRLLLKLEARRA